MADIELVPNNNTRVRVRAVQENSQTGELEPGSGLSLTIRVAESATSTGAIGSMSYVMSELSETPGDYSVTIPGGDIANDLESTYMNIGVKIQLVSATSIFGYLDAIVRPVRRL